MAAANLITGLISGGYSMFAQARARDFQAAVDQRNIDATEAASRDAGLRGVNEQTRVALASSMNAGKIKTTFASSGIDVGSGSPLDALSDAAMFGALDKAIVASNTERERYGLNVAAWNARAKRAAGISAADNQIFGTLLSTGSSAFSSGYSFSKS